MKFTELTAGVNLRHPNGTCYRIVRVKDGRVFARWRNGTIGRFGKEVVEITPAHVRGFRDYESRR